MNIIIMDGQVTQFQETPRESHVLAVKRNFRYLKGTKYFGFLITLENIEYIQVTEVTKGYLNRIPEGR